MAYNEEMEESEEMSEEVSDKSDKDEEKEYSRDDMIECLMKEASSIEEAEKKMDEYGWELVKKEGPEDMKSSKFEDIEEELGMNRMMPKVSVIRLSAARKALNNKKGK